MAEIAHLAWYRQGTVSVSDGSTKVTGSGTKFLTAGINQGAAFRIDSRPYAWEIKRVVSDTELELAAPYYGGTISNASYSIDRNHQSTLPADLSARLAKAMGNWEERYDTDMRTITGPSAYDVAKANGYTGTEAQWLESLKADKEWQTLDNRSGILTYNSAWAHNSYFRGKNLGTQISAEHLAAIKAGTFTDIYPGDYFTKNGWINIEVLGCDPFLWQWVVNGTWAGAKHHIAVRMVAWQDWKMNETATTEGGLYNSYMHNTHFPTVLAAAEAIAGGAENIAPLWTRIADAVDGTGKPTHYIQSWEKIFIPTTAERFGFVHANSSYPEHKMQLPYYRHMMRIANIYSSTNWTDMAANAKEWYTYGQQVGATIVAVPTNTTLHGCEFYFLIG